MTLKPGEGQINNPNLKPNLLSGMQPSAGSLHLGNYLGALVNWAAMPARLRCLFHGGRFARHHACPRPGNAAR
jgi:hypothetical protein